MFFPLAQRSDEFPQLSVHSTSSNRNTITDLYSNIAYLGASELLLELLRGTSAPLPLSSTNLLAATAEAETLPPIWYCLRSSSKIW